MLEKLAEYFYDPLVFWTAPLVLVALVAGWRRLRTWGLRRLSRMPPGNGPWRFVLARKQELTQEGSIGLIEGVKSECWLLADTVEKLYIFLDGKLIFDLTDFKI